MVGVRRDRSIPITCLDVDKVYGAQTTCKIYDKTSYTTLSIRFGGALWCHHLPRAGVLAVTRDFLFLPSLYVVQAWLARIRGYGKAGLYACGMYSGMRKT